MTAAAVTLEVRRLGGALPSAAPAAGARAPWTHREGLLVILRDGDGAIGVGEASPLPGYAPESLADCAAQLEARATAGACAAHIDDVRAGLTSPAARFAVETAWLDLLGRRRGRPLAALLGGDAERRVPLAALVDSPEGARAAVAAGAGALKLKLSGAEAAWPAELAGARAVRDAVGRGIALRLDVGGGFAPGLVRARLAALAELAPEYVEEPVGGAALAALRGSPVALAADESLQDPSLVPALAAACEVFVLKPTALGGLARCLELARAARAAVVTHCFDGPIALAAAAELAAALPGPPRAAGLAPHPGLAAYPPLAIPQLTATTAGSARRPGLGLELAALGLP